MAPALKKLALVLVCVLIGLFLFNMVSAPPDAKKPDDTIDYQANYNRQQQIVNDQLAKASQQQELMDRYYEKALEHQQRYDVLLDRWEKQANRMDALLNKLETK